MAGIYIHIPFCIQRCIYCDFYSTISLTQRQKYISAICKEIALRKKYIGDDTVRTIYFGGGTPSLLQKADFEQIFESLYRHFNITPDAEITLEANPDDLNKDYIKTLSNLPFNRISIGIQSFNDAELKFLGRRHNSSQAINAIFDCKEIGLKNIGIDLMYGLPGQDMDIWTSNLLQAININIQHISAYHLIYEEDTKLYRLLGQGKVKPVDELLSVDMFSVMIDKLNNAGFTHYEISNFAKEGYISQHNSSYWLGYKYLGLGASAHSYDGTNRAWNISSIHKYINEVEAGILPIELEYLTNRMRYNDYILTGMRTMWGLDLKKLESQFGKNMLSYCMENAKRHIYQGLVVEDENILKLTRKGIFTSDSIMSDLMFIG